MSAMRVCVHVRIRGRVQGVGFRAWTIDTATLLGLAGWVRNRSDSSVEAVFAGAPEVVDRMVEACRHGPRGARVDAIEQASVRELPATQGFVLLPTC